MPMAVGWPLTAATMTVKTAGVIAIGVILQIWLQKRPVVGSIIRIVLLHVRLALLRLGVDNPDMERISTGIGMGLDVSDEQLTKR